MGRFLRIMLCLEMIFLNLNFTYAQNFSRDGVYYEVINESNVIVSRNPMCNYFGNIFIPKEVSDLGEEKIFKVIGLRHNAFLNCSDLSSVNMSNCNILKLPGFIFSNCKGLVNVYFPSSLKVIGTNSFFNCSSINTLVIPDGVEIIGDFAFCNCHNLETIYLPDSLKYLGKSAFKNCDKLVNVALPNNLKRIERSCFENCVSLKHVFFGNEIIKIGKFAFKNCTRLENIDFPPSLKVIRLSAFARCDSMDEICIPENVEELSSTAFGYCFGIKKIIFKGNHPPKKFAFDTFAYPDYPFPNLDPVEIVVPEGTIKKFRGKVEYKIRNRDSIVREENEIIVEP